MADGPASVGGIYLITDTSDGRHYVGKADGAENILQRWPRSDQRSRRKRGTTRPGPLHFTVLGAARVRPSDSGPVVNAAESHFKHALDSRRHGLNRN